MTKCWELALEFIRKAPTQFGMWPESRIYTQLGKACASAGASAEVMATYSMMVEAFRVRGEGVDSATNMRFVRFCASCGFSTDTLAHAPAQFSPPISAR